MECSILEIPSPVASLPWLRTVCFFIKGAGGFRAGGQNIDKKLQEEAPRIVFSVVEHVHTPQGEYLKPTRLLLKSMNARKC